MNFYKGNKETKTCLLCLHYCSLKDNEIGLCGVNQHIDDKIKCLVYGYLSALKIDAIEKKPLYHFLPASKSLSLGTVGCNFKCSFCQNWRISQEKKISKNKYTSPSDIVKIALQNNCDSISYTYNEPTIFYPFAKDIALEAKKYNIKSVYVSNGFESLEQRSDMIGIIDAINVDLKCFDAKYYKKLGGNLEQTLDNLKFFAKNKIHLEITTLIVPSKNDKEEELKNIALFIKEHLGEEIPWHLSAFHPNYKDLDIPKTSLTSLLLAQKIGKEVGLKHVYIGNAGLNNYTKCIKCEKVLLHREYFTTIKNNLINGFCSCGQKLQGVYK